MRKFSTLNTDVSEKVPRNILAMLLTQGFDRTLDHFCNISVFSVETSSHSTKSTCAKAAGYVHPAA